MITVTVTLILQILTNKKTEFYYEPRVNCFLIERTFLTGRTERR